MTKTPDPAAALAAHVTNTRFQDLPAATVLATKNDLLDTLGCALGGSGAPGIPELLRLHRRWGGREEAGLLLVGGRLPAPQAAFMHGAMAHALDYDDTYDRGGSIHPGVAVFAAALATADLLENVHGRDMVLAAALGLDVSCRIALAATVDRGWHRTAAIGVFGATAVAGKLLELTAEQMHHAFGIAYSQAAGNRQCIVDAALTKRLQAGQAASAGVMSALLASDGFTGASGVFAGKFGFFELYQPGGYDLSKLTEDLGQAWRGDEISFKPYPCGRPLHAPIDVAVALHHQLDLESDGEDIASVVVTAPPAVFADQFSGAVHKRRPRQVVEAQFALPFLLANALLRGTVGIDDVGRFDDPAVLTLAARIEARPGEGALSIELHHRDGRSARLTAGVPLGAPENPLSTAQRLVKFRDCAAHAVQPVNPASVEIALSFVEALEHQTDAKDLLRGLTAPGG
jgi:2-methylcitrate dehydratase PrpD